jgi:hypothetical protein
MVHTLLVRVERTERFDRESERFQLRYCCEECAHYDARRTRCRHEWPVDDHLRAALVAPRSHVLFCKEFELC